MKKFNETMGELDADLKIWRSDVIPLYVSGPGTDMEMLVREWDGYDFN
jgi:hypothetical protein